MFKKLFISLIILSTLASEGITSIPGNVYNFLSDLESVTGTVSHADLETVTPKEIYEKSSFSTTAFKLTQSSLLKFCRFSLDATGKYNGVSDIASIAVPESDTLNFIYASRDQVYYHNRLILFKADTSPPKAFV